MLEKVGVRAVVEGYGQYRTQAAGVNQATASMGQTARAAAAGTNTVNASLGSFLRTTAAVAIGTQGLALAHRALAGSISGTVGASIAFESSFAGIRKTTEATEAEFKKLEQTNRNLAKSLPTTVNEFNRIGELGGQLGVAAADLATFEKVIADLGNTTDLTTDQAATSFAQLANILNLPIAQLDRAGSTLVELGNKSAATESEILEFSLRIAGAGKIAGLTTAEVEGIGTAFASVGVQAEAGGTSIQKVLITITEAAARGGKDLDVLAATAGLTAKEFQNLARSNPAEAFTRFVEGLSAAGDRAFSILEDLDIGDQRVIRSFLSVANAGDLLRRSIDTGTEAFAQNVALQNEAEKRYKTTAAQLQILKNNFNDIGISIGTTLLPGIVKTSNATVQLLNALRPLGPVLSAIASQLPIIVAGVVAFGTAMAAVRIASFISNLTLLSSDAALLARTFPNLTASMLGLRGAALVTAQALAAGNLGGALQGLKLALATPTGAAIALTVGILALDQASQLFDNQSLIQQFTLSNERARGAAEGTALYDKALQDLNRTLSQSQDPSVAFSRATDKIVERVRTLAADIAREQGNVNAGRSPGDVFQNFVEANTFGILGDGAGSAQERIAELEGELEKLIELAPELVRTATDPQAAFAALSASIDSALASGVSSEVAAQLREAKSAASDAVVEFQDLQHSGTSAAEALVRLRIAGGLTTSELQRMAQSDPAAVLEAFANGMQLSTSEAQKLAFGVTEVTDTFEEQKEAVETLADAIDLAFADLDQVIDPATVALQLQKNALEEQRRAMVDGTAAADALDQKIAALGEALADSSAKTEQSRQLVTLYAAALDAMDVPLTRSSEQLRTLAEKLDELPEERRIEIQTLIDQGKLQEVLNIMALLRAGVRVPVAFAIGGSIGRAPEGSTPGPFGAIGGFLKTIIPPELPGLADAGEDAITRFGGAVGGAGGAAGGASQHIDRLTRVLQAASDGTISYAEALELGIGIQEAATLELEIARQKELDEAFRLQVGLAALSQKFVGMTPQAIQLAVGLQNIAKHIRETGISINKFLSDVATDALEGFRSALDALFSRPTRETLGLQLKLAELEKKRLQRVGGGATDKDLKGIDKEIEQVRNLIALREKEVEIERLKIELADDTILSDRAQLDQAKLLGDAIARQSREVTNLNGVLFNETLAHILLTQRALAAADALGQVTTGGQGQPFSHGGWGDFGRGTPATLHGREVIVPLDGGTMAIPPQVRAMAMAQLGGATSNVFAPSLTQQGLDMRAGRAMFHRWVDEWFQSGFAKSNNMGAPISSGVS